MRAFLFLLILAAAVAVAACSSNASVKNVGPDEFAKVIAGENVFLLDVHVPEQEHINGTDAVIPYNELASNVDKLPADKSTPIAVYCRSGSMSAEATKTLKELGYANIYNLVGGANAWRAKEAGTVSSASLEPVKEITVYKSQSCGCCSNYVNELGKQGFDVNVVNMPDLSSIKERYHIPKSMESCHTAVIGNYFVEGHVPAEAVNRLLDEKPGIDGIILPGMPDGSPGMVGTKRGPFKVYALSGTNVFEFMQV